MRHRRKRRHNPSDPAVTYWIVLSAIVVGGVAIWAYKNMSDKDRAKTGIGAPPLRKPLFPNVISMAEFLLKRKSLTA